MTIQSYKMGPGSLVFARGSTLAAVVTCQVISCVATCQEDVETVIEAEYTIDGDYSPPLERVTLTWTLSATLQQDLAAAGFVTWSWTNAKTQQPFEFIPSTAVGRKVTGTVNVYPISIGGQAKTKPTSDFTWRGVIGSDFTLQDAA